MNLNAKTILNHKVVAVVNLLWAIFHIWIAITIEQDYFFLAIVIVFVLTFIGAYRISENKARYVFLVTGLLYFIPCGRHHTYIDVKWFIDVWYSGLTDLVSHLCVDLVGWYCTMDRFRKIRIWGVWMKPKIPNICHLSL